MSKREKRRKRDGADADLEVTLVRPYGRTLFAFLCTAGAGAFMIYRADENTRGLIINGIIHLDPGQADVFYAVLGLFCVVVAVLMLVGLYALLPGQPFRFYIDDKEIRLPRSPLWKLGEAVVFLDEVLGVEMRTQGRALYLVIVSEAGRFPLPVTYLPAGWSHTQVADRIMAGVRRAKEVDPPPSP